MNAAGRVALVSLLVVSAGCGSPDGHGAAGWAGAIDTLASGQVVVRNPAAPLWSPGEEWQVVEDLRLGRIDGDHPDVFGHIVSLEVDGAGRLWVFDDQAQELRVFAASGNHVRTIGRRGSGPGEFAGVARVELGPDGNIWVMDPRNSRLSVFDTAGVFLQSRPAPGGFLIRPWPGRFAANGDYFAPVPRTNGEFRLAIVRYDSTFAAVDTLHPPRDPIQRDRFERRSNGHVMVAGVPFQGGLVWRLSERGTIWAMVTDEYRLFELSASGDTLRTITRPFTALPVTDADRERAREELGWFTDQGGQIDLSRLPRRKPGTVIFFPDDAGNIWVERVTRLEETAGVYDVFDPEGRFLGTVRLPSPLSRSPSPVVREGALHGVTSDDLDVQYVVRFRIIQPPASDSARAAADLPGEHGPNADPRTERRS